LKRNSAWNDAIWWARFQRCEDVLRLIGESPTGHIAQEHARLRWTMTKPRGSV
jgi:hypothetical protein